MSIYKKYKCKQCGNVKDVMVNHDLLPELWEWCTEECMWSREGEKGPVLLSESGEKTGFSKRRFIKL